MAWLTKATPTLSDEDKKKALADVLRRIKAGDTADTRTLLAAALGKSGDDPLITSLLKDVAFYGLPDEEKKNKTDFFAWWGGANVDKRAAAIETASAWMLSR